MWVENRVWVENHICAYGIGSDRELRELDNEELSLGSSDGGGLDKLGTYQASGNTFMPDFRPIHEGKNAFERT